MTSPWHPGTSEQFATGGSPKLSSSETLAMMTGLSTRTYCQGRGSGGVGEAGSGLAARREGKVRPNLAF